MSIASIDPTVPRSREEQAGGRLQRRRTINRLALALVGVAAGVAGQIFFSQEALWDGLLFYGIAIILFNVALADRLFPKARASLSGYRLPTCLGLHDGWRRTAGFWLLVLAGAVSLVDYYFFGRVAARNQAWGFYLSGLGLLIIGGVLLTKGDSWRTTWRTLLPNRTIALGLAFVIALGLFMRLYNFTALPFGVWYDEAEAGLQARRMLADPDYRPVFFPSPINHPIYLPGAYALALAFFGNTVYSMRLVSVLFGLGGVLAAYLFGRELRGPRFGLALAFLMAVARWPVNFSRIAMTGIDTPFFEFLSLYFLVRVLRRGRLRDVLWAGLTLGVGLMIYTGLRLYVLSLILFVIVAALRWNRLVVAALSDGSWRAHLIRLGMITLAIWLVTMPLIQFALDSPQQFWYRTRQISVFTRREQPNLTQALAQNVSRHLLMLTYRGDRNGRHNLPGEPMLDPAMAVLATLGFGLALVRTRDPANLFFLILFPISLLGGILSVDFEAPQSLRSIAVMPVAIYFIGLALAALGREAEVSLKPLPRVWVLGPAAALAGFMLFHNATTYFGRQAVNFASWNEFSTAESIMGRKMADLGPGYTYYLSPLLTGHPTTRFLAPEVTDRRDLPLPDALPIRVSPDRPVALFIHPDDRWIYDRAQQLYPNAVFETIYSPGEDGNQGRPVVYFADLQPTDLAAIQGLELRYLPHHPADWPPDGDPEPPLPLQTGRAQTIQAIWPADSPVKANFLAEWQGTLYVPDFGSYVLRLTTPGPGRLELDGNLVLDGEGDQSVSLPLAEGNHLIRVQAQAAPGEVALSWRPPDKPEALIPQWALYPPAVANHGLLGSYYPNDRWEGQPALQRIDPFLDTYFHLLPLPRPYTVEWTGALDVPQSGLYRLGLRAVSEAELFVDGQHLVTTIAPDEYIDEAITLEAGLHDLLIRFKDTTDRSRIHLAWTTPAGVTEPIPSQNLWPPLGRYPERTSEPGAQVLPLRLKWVTTLGGPGSEPGQFFEPRDLAVLSNGHLVVADTANQRVQLLDAQGNPLQTLTGDEFPFVEPLAVGVNSRDDVYVLDSTLQYVYRYNGGGTFIERFGGPEAQLFHPRGLTIFEDDTIALADTGTSRLAFFRPDGNPAGKIGSLGDEPGQFNEPTDVLRNAQGHYFVVEAMNGRLQRLDVAGNPLVQWAVPAGFAFNGPHLAFGPDDSIFMTESESGSLFRFAPDGELLDQWQTIEPVRLAAPVGIYFDPVTRRLYLTDVQTHQIQVFQVEAVE